METLSEAKAHVQQQLDKGVHCPCCGQYVKRYKRKLSAGMALILIYLHRQPKGEWVQVEKLIKETRSIPMSARGDYHKLRFWGLIEQQDSERSDGSDRVGYWRITDKGRRFVEGEIRVAAHIYLKTGLFDGFSEETVTIRQALGKRFNYSELMAPVVRDRRPDASFAPGLFA